MNTALDQLTYTTAEAADVLRVSAKTVRRMTASGRLPVVRIGSRVLIPRQALADWVAANTRAAS